MSLHVADPVKAGAIVLALAWMWFWFPLGCASVRAAEPDQGVLRVVGDEIYPPYLFRDQDGQPAGYLVDLWRLWETKTGVQVRIEVASWAEAQRMLLRGDADVIENIYRTPEREPNYDFSAPYATLPVAIYSHDAIRGIRDVDSLRGFEVGVMDGDACVDHLLRAGITNWRSLGAPRTSRRPWRSRRRSSRRQPPGTQRAGSASAMGAVAGARVLLAEDNPINREVALELLRELAVVDVEVAENGLVALDRLRSGHYDLVLMDLQMPVMDGLTATREIRKLPGLARLPIVAMTANAMPGDRARCLEAGMNDHIAKPIAPGILASTLKQWVRRRDSASSVERRLARGSTACPYPQRRGGADRRHCPLRLGCRARAGTP